MRERKQAIKTALGIITFTVVLVYLINHTTVIANILKSGIALLLPFLLGCGIAFVINIPMRWIENTFFKNEKGKLYKYKRTISMVFAYVAVVAVVAFVGFKVFPQVAETFEKIQEKLPDFIEKAKAWLVKYTDKYPDITEKIMSIEVDMDEIGNMFKENGTTILNKTVSIFTSIINAVVNIFVGIVFSVYILGQKEKLAKDTKMLVYAMFKEKTADELMVFGKIANTTFSKFFACQFREGIILGVMFMISMKLLGLPFPLTIGVLIAFTALIPIFGAFFGLAIGAFLLLVESPKYVIWFIVLFFVLQFLENYLIYPKLVGGDIGLSAIWVLLAVIVGGDLMGVVGMFIFIPLVSVFYSYIRSLVRRNLKNRNINVDEKVVADDAVFLMESRRRMFQPKSKDEKKQDQEQDATSENNQEA